MQAHTSKEYEIILNKWEFSWLQQGTLGARHIFEPVFVYFVMTLLLTVEIYLHGIKEREWCIEYQTDIDINKYVITYNFKTMLLIRLYWNVILI